jgi:hypothetical protein
MFIGKATRNSPLLQPKPKPSLRQAAERNPVLSFDLVSSLPAEPWPVVFVSNVERVELVSSAVAQDGLLADVVDGQHAVATPKLLVAIVASVAVGGVSDSQEGYFGSLVEVRDVIDERGGRPRGRTSGELANEGPPFLPKLAKVGEGPFGSFGSVLALEVEGKRCPFEARKVALHRLRADASAESVDAISVESSSAPKSTIARSSSSIRRPK